MGKFQIIAEPMKGLKLLQPKVFEDSRGYFVETYNKKDFIEVGIDVDFVQDNQAKSVYGVIRGLHYQMPPFAQSKLVRAIKGIILDVALDIRKDSPTFGQYFIIELTEDNHLQLFIPKGFAHGYAVLSEEAIVFYKTDQYYNPEAEAGINLADDSLKIEWNVPEEKRIISDKDRNLPLFKQAKIFE